MSRPIGERARRGDGGGLGALLVVGLGASVAPLDFAVNMAFPAITAAFSLPTHAIRWVAVCYVLTYGSLMLGFGAMGDRIGYLRTFRAGLALSALAFVLCALAPGYGWLLGARVVQGVGAALTLACAPALATQIVDESRRTWALSVYAASAAFAGVVAPVVGGAAIAWLGWPGVYWFRLPIALAALACLPAVSRGRDLEGPRSPHAFDAHGSALLGTGVALLFLGPSLAAPGSGLAVPLLAFGAGAATLVAFARRDRRAHAPFLPASVARDTAFRLVNLAACGVQFASFAVPLVVPYFLLRAAGWDALPAGVLLGVWAIGSLLGSWAAPRAVAVHGSARAAVAAVAAMAAGLAAISTWSVSTSTPALAASLALQGAGLGLFQVAYTDRVIAALPAASRGVAGSLTMVTRTVGIVLGATAWMWMLQSVEAAALAAGDRVPAHAFVHAFHAVFRTAAIAAGVVLAVMVVTGGAPPLGRGGRR